MSEPRHIYILGIGGTLMGSLAQLAKEAGYQVTGSDKALYPPMSDQLAAAGIPVFEGFDPRHLDPAPDLVIVGNAGLPRGHDGVEAVLNSSIPYTSGAEFLGRELLANRWVVAVSGTHGKTTTASMVAWILEDAGLDPGYLIGGVPGNFGRSARLGSSPFFVVEADEYDTSYFDRRSKFLHYRPRTLIINNLEYDHADIFPDLAAIQNQFHLLLRSVPGNGAVIAPTDSEAVGDVLAMGCWTPVLRFGAGNRRGTTENEVGSPWQTRFANADGSRFDVLEGDQVHGSVGWGLLGEHNASNGLAALLAARHCGVALSNGLQALSRFQGVKRRMERIAHVGHTAVYDDFAHHPTAIRTTLAGLRKSVGSARILAIIEPRTHTMSLGTLRNDLATCTAAADEVLFYRGPNITWDVGEVVSSSIVPARSFDDLDLLIAHATQFCEGGKPTHIVIMSNGGFENIYQRLPAALAAT